MRVKTHRVIEIRVARSGTSTYLYSNVLIMNSVFALVSIFTWCVCKAKEYASRFNGNNLNFGPNSNKKKMQNPHNRG